MESHVWSKKLKEKKDKWISHNDYITDINSLMPSSKVCSVSEYSDYLEIVLQSRSTLMNLYGSLKWRQLRRKADIKRQKAYEVICKRIAGKKLDAVVAYGSAKFSASSKGNPPLPTTSLYKKLLQKKVCAFSMGAQD